MACGIPPACAPVTRGTWVHRTKRTRQIDRTLEVLRDDRRDRSRATPHATPERERGAEGDAMTDMEHLKAAFERNTQTLTLRPSRGQKSYMTKFVCTTV